MDENIFQSDESIETIMEVDSIEDHDTLLYNSNDNMSETGSQFDYNQYSGEESLMIIEDDEGSLSDNSRCIKEKSESNLIKISEEKKSLSDKFENPTEVPISDQQMPIKKKIVSAVILNTPKNVNLSTRPKNDSLNLEKIAVPKQDISKVNLSPIISRQIKKTPSITVVSSSVKPTTTHPRILPRPPGITNINCNKSFSRPKQDFKIISSNEPKTGMYVLPQNGVNYMIRNGESNSQSLKSNSDTVLESAGGKQRIIVTSKVPQRANNNMKVTKFIARMQKLPGGTYKVLPAQGKVPVDLENVFKRNSHFVKQKTNNFIGKSNIHTNINEINQFQSIRPISTAKAWHFGNVSKDKRLIPHTITSKDLIENRKNILIEKREIKLNSNDNHEIKQSEYMVRQQMSESLNQSGGQSLSIDKYGW